MDEPEPRPRDTPALLKIAARTLFAERGVDGVTIREIALAASQKIHGSVGYHFGSKDALVCEIVLDGAILIDQRRNYWLDSLEAACGPRTVREVVDVVICAGVDMAEDSRKNGYNRFIVMLAMTYRQLFIETLDRRWNSGLPALPQTFRRLMPDMPAAKNQRFVFMGAYLGGALSARDAELAYDSRDYPSWQSEATLAHFAKTMTPLINI